MSSATAVHLLFAAALATQTAAMCAGQKQDPAREDWSRHVNKACTSRRYGIRLAAARKVAAGGGAAVPAVEQYAAEAGLNALPVALVDAIADSGDAGATVSRLLWSWTMNPDFYWRSSAMRGLALRLPTYRELEATGETPGLPSDQVEYLMSVRAERDPAWLMRSHARFGLILGGKPVDEIYWLPERDPRARVRLATLLLGAGVTPPMQPMIDALANERTFLGTPWGANLATESSKALRRWLGDAFPTFEAGDKQKAIAAILPVVEAQTQQVLLSPEPLTDLVVAATGGIEVLSCKFGDKFVQWTDDGAVYFGLDGAESVQLNDETWRQLSATNAAMTLKKSVGVVICDSLRVAQKASKTNAKIAPASMPAAVTDWLKQLIRALDVHGETERATELRRGLGQFEGR